MREMLLRLGEDPDRDGLRQTPERMERALQYLTKGYQENAEETLRGAMFDVEYDEMVIVKDGKHLCMMMRGVEKQHSSTINVLDAGCFPGERDKGRVSRAYSCKTEHVVTWKSAHWLPNSLDEARRWAQGYAREDPAAGWQHGDPISTARAPSSESILLEIRAETKLAVAKGRR